MANAKGTIVVGPVKFLRKHREQALEILPEPLHHYLNEKIDAASWYPEEDNLELLRAMLKLMSMPRDQALLHMGELSARSHGEGIYSHLLEGGASPTGAFALWRSMHDTGELDIRRSGDSLNIELTGYEYPSREMCATTEGYVLESLRMGGMKPTAEKLSCVIDGADRCAWRITWKRKS